MKTQHVSIREKSTLRHPRTVARAAALAALLAGASALTASARALLYSYDFDTIESNQLVHTGINKGSGTVQLTLKRDQSATMPYELGGPFGSGACLVGSTHTSLWLGDGSASLGCGTQKGFTISFWVKSKSNHPAWSNFFGFRVGGVDYRTEYVNGVNGSFVMYYNTSSGATAASETINDSEAGVWRHYAFVFTPNCGTELAKGTCMIYRDGEFVSSLSVAAAGNLQQVHIGNWVRQNGKDRKNQFSGARLDDLAIYDYPATREQIRWLSRRQAIPGVVAARTMPLMWPLDEGGDSTSGVLTGAAGTGPETSYRWGVYPSYYSGFAAGALGSRKSFQLSSYITHRLDETEETQKTGASLTSGMALSFWIKAPASLTLWRDVMSFRVGNRYQRFEWCRSNPAGFTLYGGVNMNGNVTLKADTWQHFVLNWNRTTSQMESYLDGVKLDASLTLSEPTAADTFKSLTLGHVCFGNDGSPRNNNNAFNSNGIYMDEIAVYNHSLSLAQIQFLTNNIPVVTPLDTTNFVRTIAADTSWNAGGAPWNVRRWNDTSAAWEMSDEVLFWPTLEDDDVEATLAFSASATLTNDTVVTPKKLLFRAAAGEGVALAPVLVCTDTAHFAPQTLDVGDGLQLTVPLYLPFDGTLVLGTGSKILFDPSNYYRGGTTVAFTPREITCPAGTAASDLLSFFGVTDERFTLSLADDGKTILVSAATIPVEAVWTGAGDGTTLDAPANWSCRNNAGDVLPGALPCEFTRVTLSDGLAALSVPVGTVIPWRSREIAAGSVSLTADVDWRVFPRVTFPKGVTVDLDGRTLSFDGVFAGTGTITDTSETGGTIRVAPAEGATSENAAVAFTGSLRLEKDGAGEFVAKAANQTYTGGTQILAGILKLGTAASPLGAKGAAVTVAAGALYDMNGFCSTTSCSYNYTLAGTFRQSSSTESDAWNNAWKVLGSTFTLSADATVSGTSFLFANPDGVLDLALNGHTLTFETTPQLGLGAMRADGEGTLVFLSGSVGLRGDSFLTNVTVDVRQNTTFKLESSWHVGDFSFAPAQWGRNATTPPYIHVHGTYHLGAMRPPLMMENGSTLDLGAGLLNLTNTLASALGNANNLATPGEVRFAEGATVFIDLGERSIDFDEPVIRWNGLPAGIETVRFKPAPGGRQAGFIKREDGLYAGRSFMILVK
jgi:autotransporter-associated beta strand protein